MCLTLTSHTHIFSLAYCNLIEYPTFLYLHEYPTFLYLPKIAEEIIACELTRVEAKKFFELLPVLKYVSPVCVRIRNMIEPFQQIVTIVFSGLLPTPKLVDPGSRCGRCIDWTRWTCNKYFSP